MRQLLTIVPHLETLCGHPQCHLKCKTEVAIYSFIATFYNLHKNSNEHKLQFDNDVYTVADPGGVEGVATPLVCIMTFNVIYYY